MKRLLCFMAALLLIGAAALAQQAAEPVVLTVGRGFSLLPTPADDAAKKKENKKKDPKKVIKGEGFSQDTAVAGVDDWGYVMAYAPGETTVRFTAKGGQALERQVLVVDSSMPQAIQKAIDAALEEWQQNLGNGFGKANKYTEWFYPGSSFGWCGAFAAYALDRAAIPMQERKQVPVLSDGTPHAVREAGVPKLIEGFTRMDRIGRVPRSGYLLMYGRNGYGAVHVGMVTRAQYRGGGVYLLETVEGNMSNRIKRYAFLYDSLAKDRENNTRMLPSQEQAQKDVFQYELHPKGWYVNLFGQTWY